MKLVLNKLHHNDHSFRILFIIIFKFVTECSASQDSVASIGEGSSLENNNLQADDLKVYKNPKNRPNDDCPRDEEAAQRLVRTCQRKCISDEDCLSPKRVCLCDDVCGMTCIKPDKECDELVNPMFGFVEVTGRIIGAKARYKCQKGYHLIGEEERSCQSDGSWSRVPPECEENLYCTDPPQIANAKYDKLSAQARFEVNRTLQYTCNEGFLTKGFSSAKCYFYNGTMRWFGPELKCDPISCGNPGNIMNGFKEGSCYSYSCRITYYCRPGFELIGRMDHYCQQDGLWSPRELPSCKAVECTIPEDPENGNAVYTTTSYNSVVTYECEQGYMIVGTATRRCGPSKEWTETRPQCKEINCGSAGALYNGYIDGSRTDLHARISFHCNPGMAFEGVSREAICISNGTWSSPLPRCLSPCIVPSIENGEVNNTSPREKVDHGFELNVFCDTNYELAQGTFMPACSNGTWSRYPRCTEARCKKLPMRPKHGMVIAPKSGHGESARYRCKDGYKLTGESTIKCHFGNWTGKMPICTEIYCPFPGTIKHGKVLLVGNMGMYDYRDYVRKVKNNRQIRFKCNRGYYLVKGPPGATCVAGRWSPDKLPKCRPDLHPRIKWINKRSIDEKDFTAMSVYPFYSTERNSSHSDKNVQEYLDHSSIPESFPSLNAYSFIGAMDVQGNQPVGWSFMRNDAGTEDNDRIRRGALGKEQRKRMRMELRQKRRLNRARKKKNGRSKEFAHCEEIERQPYMKIEIVRQGKDSNFTYSSGARFHITCLHGYGLNIGNRTAKCARGRWKPMKPECFNLPCSVPDTEYGSYEYNGFHITAREVISHGEVLKFSCLPGFNIIGTDTMRCWYGEWAVTGKIPECHSTPCMLTHIPNGKLVSGQNENFTIMHGSLINYSCNSGYVKGITDISCYQGNFEPSKPACIKSNGKTAILNTKKKSINLSVANLQLKNISDENNPAGRTYQDSDMAHRRHAPNMRYCHPPHLVKPSLMFKNLFPLEIHDMSFPDGTNITYDCLSTGAIGNPQVWTIQCVTGQWVGHNGTCVANGTAEPVDYGTRTCDFIKPEDDKVITFYNDVELTRTMRQMPAGSELVTRCFDIGKYLMIGSIRMKCKHGEWTGIKPRCHGLSQEHKYALDKPPTILFRHMRGPIAQTNDGHLLVYPGTVLHLECLWIRRYGTPRWNVSQTVTDFGPKKKKKKKKNKMKFKKKGGGGLSISGKYPEGWTTDPARNRQLEYRLSLYKAKADDSGAYICTTPSRKTHMVKIKVEAVHCPVIVKKSGLRANPNATMMSTKVRFSCDPGAMLIGANDIHCKASGNWSSPHPHCEKVRCRTPLAPINGRIDGKGPYHVGNMVQTSCLPNYMMKGHAMLVCQQDGQWSGEVPECVEACTYPGTIISGSMSSVKFYYAIGDKITYACSDGYNIHGSNNIECLIGARWSASVPTCLPGQ